MKVDSGHCVENGLKEAGGEEIVRGCRVPGGMPGGPRLGQ